MSINNLPNDPVEDKLLQIFSRLNDIDGKGGALPSADDGWLTGPGVVRFTAEADALFASKIGYVDGSLGRIQGGVPDGVTIKQILFLSEYPHLIIEIEPALPSNTNCRIVGSDGSVYWSGPIGQVLPTPVPDYGMPNVIVPKPGDYAFISTGAGA